MAQRSVDPGSYRHFACRGPAPFSSGAKVLSPGIEADRVADTIIEAGKELYQQRPVYGINQQA